MDAKQRSKVRRALIHLDWGIAEEKSAETRRNYLRRAQTLLTEVLENEANRKGTEGKEATT